MIAAPNRPAEMRTFDPDMVTRLLDLVSSHFEYVVIDMPRTWFSWTDSVLLGSNKLFIVSEMTVPSLKQAKGAGRRDPRAARRRAAAAGDRQPVRAAHVRSGPEAVPISSRRSATTSPAPMPNNYRLVREAIDRGVPLDEVKPGNNITLAAQEADLPAEAGARPPMRRV